MANDSAETEEMLPCPLPLPAASTADPHHNMTTTDILDPVHVLVKHKMKMIKLNPGLAEPRYALTLQTV